MKRKRAGRDEPDFSPSASSDEASPDLPSPSFGSGSDDAWGSEDGAGAGAQGTDRRREKKRRALKDKAMKAKYKPKAEVSTTDVKKRIRDTERLLSRPNLPADVQQDLERRLRALQATLPTVTEQVYDKETSKKNYEKYKYVRFVERQKVTRKLKQVEKRLRKAEEDGEDADELRQEKEGLEVDLAYTLNYPLLFKYVSLYPVTHQPGEKTPSTSETRRSDVLRDTVRAEIRRRTEAGAELAQEAVGFAVRKALKLGHPELFPELLKAKKGVPPKGGAAAKEDGGRASESPPPGKPARAKATTEGKATEKPKKDKTAGGPIGGKPANAQRAGAERPQKRPKQEPPAPNPFADDDFFVLDDDDDRALEPGREIPEAGDVLGDGAADDGFFPKRRGGKKLRKEENAGNGEAKSSAGDPPASLGPYRGRGRGNFGGGGRGGGRGGGSNSGSHAGTSRGSFRGRGGGDRRGRGGGGRGGNWKPKLGGSKFE